MVEDVQVDGPRTGPPAATDVRALWRQLSATMRLLRRTAGRSLRRVELESGVGRGTLSQVETGKARPNRIVVEWYDTAFGGDGLLLSMYAEARGVHGPSRGTPELRPSFDPDDALTVVDHDPPRGQLVPCDSAVQVTWTVRNTGTVAWRRRRVARLGARAGIRLLRSDAGAAVPDCDPGDEITIGLVVGVPSEPATYAATWQVVGSAGEPVLPLDLALSVELVARRR